MECKCGVPKDESEIPDATLACVFGRAVVVNTYSGFNGSFKVQVPHLGGDVRLLDMCC